MFSGTGRFHSLVEENSMIVCYNYVGHSSELDMVTIINHVHASGHAYSGNNFMLE